MTERLLGVVAALTLVVAQSAAGAGAGAGTPGPIPLTRWESFGSADGLPSERVLAVAVDRERVWVGTDAGLALYAGGKWTRYGTAEGLAFPVILSLAVDPVTRDVWVGTMQGLARLSAGRFETFTQFNSGLPNDVVFGVCVERQDVWVATTAGVARLDTRGKKWDVFTSANSPQDEPWAYGIDCAGEKVHAALWGGGVLERVGDDQWKAHRDPDGRLDVDLLRDDGLIHPISTSLGYADRLLWVGSYFGLSRYDGRHWRTYAESDSGLPSNFINSVRARGREAWLGTDRGLATIDADSDRWVAYVPKSPLWADGSGRAGCSQGVEGQDGWEARIFEGARLVDKQPLVGGPAGAFVYGVDFQGEAVWVATAKGVSRGSRDGAMPESAKGRGARP